LQELPEDIERALQADSGNPDQWNNLTAIQRNDWIFLVGLVKKMEPRKEDIHHMIEELTVGKRK